MSLRVGIGVGESRGVDHGHQHGGLTIPKLQAAHKADVSGPDNISKVDRLRSRDGVRCWLCDRPMDFDAVPNSKKAPTFEHLIAKCRGGPDTVENLVLCHRGCNKQLGDRPLVDKIRMRERRRKKGWIASLRPQC
jgi:hypothetical protein